jgi:hypothetical protein
MKRMRHFPNTQDIPTVTAGRVLRAVILILEIPLRHAMKPSVDKKTQ